jgi:hypothetical protein
MQTFSPSPKVPAGQAVPHTPLLQVRVAPGMDELGHELPQAPQLLKSPSRFTQDVGLAVGQPCVADPLRAPHFPFARPVVAFEQAWQARLHALSQQTPSRQAALLHSLAAPQPLPWAFFFAQASPEQ